MTTQPIISIDAHKDTCTYIVKHDDEIQQDPTTIPSTNTAIDRLAENHPNAEFLLEASGVHEWIHDRLIQHGCEVFVGHPIKRQQNEDKNDAEDAERFAGRHQVGEVTQVHIAPPNLRRIRDVVRQRAGLIKEKTRLTNRLKSTLARWGYFAENNPDPLSDDGRAHVTDDRPELAPLYALVDELDEHIDTLEDHVNQHADAFSEVERLKTIPGVGNLIALALHAEIQHIERFPNAEALVSYFGLDPEIEQSGDQRYHLHQISKEGRPYVRGLLVQAAWTHVAFAEDSSLTAKYHELRQRKGKQVAIVATARRLLRVAYPVLAEERAFEPSPPSRFVPT